MLSSGSGDYRGPDAAPQRQPVEESAHEEEALAASSSSSSDEEDALQATHRSHVGIAPTAIPPPADSSALHETTRRASRRVSMWAQLPYIPSRRATMGGSVGLPASLAAKRMSLFSPTARLSMSGEDGHPAAMQGWKPGWKSPPASPQVAANSNVHALEALRRFSDDCCCVGTTLAIIEPLRVTTPLARIEEDTSPRVDAKAIAASLREAIDTRRCSTFVASLNPSNSGGTELQQNPLDTSSADTSASPTLLRRLETAQPSFTESKSGQDATAALLEKDLEIASLRAQLQASNHCVEKLLQTLVKMALGQTAPSRKPSPQHHRSPTTATTPTAAMKKPPLALESAPASTTKPPDPRKLSFAAVQPPAVLMPPSFRSTTPLDDGASDADAEGFSHEVKETSQGSMLEVELGSTSLNQYILLAQIGQGAQGDVFYAVDTTSGEPRAIKAVKRPSKIATPLTPSPRGSAMDAVRNMQRVALEREIAVMKRCRHRHLVSLHEVIDDPELDSMYLVMQYVEHGPLLRMHPDGRADSSLSPESVVLFGRQLCSALRYLHAHGVLHRDIKPENILLGQNDQVYLADFGVAELFDASSSGSSDDAELPHSVPTVHNTNGTLPFQAPELLSEGVFAGGEAVDVWALGMTLYVFLYGRLPFVLEGKTRSGVIDCILEGNFVFDDLHEETDPALATVNHSPAFASASSSDRNLRQQTARVIKAMLHADPKLRPSATVVRKMLKGISLSTDTEDPLLVGASPDSSPTISVVHRRGSIGLL